MDLIELPVGDLAVHAGLVAVMARLEERLSYVTHTTLVENIRTRTVLRKSMVRSNEARVACRIGRSPDFTPDRDCPQGRD